MAKRTINLDTKEIEVLLEALYAHKSTDHPLHKKLTNVMKTIKVRSAKNKGMALQIDFGKLLAETLGLTFDQKDDDAQIASRPSGQHGSDIILRGEAKKRLPFSFEAKCTENLALVAAINQAKENSDGVDWVVVHRKKVLKEDVIIMAVNTFIKMLKKGEY